MITSDLPLPGKTSITIYQSDLVAKDGTYVDGLHLSFSTAAHADNGIKSLTVESKIGGASVSGLPEGKTDTSVMTGLQVTGVPPMDTAVSQTVVDQKGFKTSRIFMVHIKARRPGAKLNKAQLKALRLSK